MYQITFSTRIIKAIGCQNIILTNACGGVRESFKGPTFMAWTDHINYFGDDPLIGIELDDPFVDMTKKYDKGMRDLLIASGKKVGVTIE